MKINIINRISRLNSTEVSLAEVGILESMNYFLRVYTFLEPHCGISVILCDKVEDLEKEWNKYYGYGDEAGLPLKFDGQFLVPDEKTDILSMIICVNKDQIEGIEQYYHEKENGSLAGTPTEERGLKMMAFWHFVELVMHEFSHMCSYDRMMRLIDWEDTRMSKDIDYHLHDEYLARFRGTKAMLLMAEPYMETDMLFSLYLGYWTDLGDSFRKRQEETKDFIEHERELLGQALPDLQEMTGLDDEGFVKMLEEEFGHKLKYGGEKLDGNLRLSDYEVIEFSAVDEIAELTEPYLYFLRNPVAVYEGVQFAGMITAFYDYLCDDKDLMIGEEELHLENVIDIPFWNYVDASRINQQANRFKAELIRRGEKAAGN